MDANAAYLKALDPVGGQAIFEHNGQFFRISFEDEWKPVQLANRCDAVRCITISYFDYCDEAFSSVDSLIAAVRTRWDKSFQVPEVPLSEIIHLFPEKIQREWAMAQEFNREKQEELSRQARRFLEDRPSRRTRRRPKTRLYDPSWEQRGRPALHFLHTGPPVPPPFWSAAMAWAIKDAPQVFSRFFGRPFAFFDVDDLAATATYRTVAAFQAGKISYEIDEKKLHIIVYNMLIKVSIDSFRRWIRPPATVRLEDVPEELLADKRAEYREPSAELREAVELAIARLNPLEARVIRAFLLPWPPDPPEWHTNSKLAELLSVSEGTVKSIRSKALRKLRRFLEEMGIGPPQQSRRDEESS